MWCRPIAGQDCDGQVSTWRKRTRTNHQRRKRRDQTEKSSQTFLFHTFSASCCFSTFSRNQTSGSEEDFIPFTSPSWKKCKVECWNCLRPFWHDMWLWKAGDSGLKDRSSIEKWKVRRICFHFYPRRKKWNVLAFAFFAKCTVNTFWFHFLKKKWNWKESDLRSRSEIFQSISKNGIFMRFFVHNIAKDMVWRNVKLIFSPTPSHVYRKYRKRLSDR